ncbi:MAG TPA: hypothetical protein VFZ65_22040 [Planctomycetota bacterium]|nr:hypothetical protein [Planctomycetota bacterium]
MSTRLRVASLLAAVLPAACGGVSHTIRTDVPAPRSIAVLPFGGTADPELREAARSLVQSRLRSQGYQVAEAAWTDRLLSEHGWLHDPVQFDPDALPVGPAIAALGVDALAVGTNFSTSSFNVLILRRQAFGGSVQLRLGDGTTWWSAQHSASTLGGFLLTSGQVFEELRAQGAHGTPMATLALVDEFAGDVAGTVPAQKGTERPSAGPALSAIHMQHGPAVAGLERIVVEATASPGATVCCDLAPYVEGVPMVAQAGRPERFRGSHDLPAGTTIGSIAVRARDAFGRETRAEVKP